MPSAWLLLGLVPLLGVSALVFLVWRLRWVTRQDAGTERMARIAAAIQEGAHAFLRAEYRVLGLFVGVTAVLLAVAGFSSDSSSPWIAVSFLLGALCSGAAGFIGMGAATRANVRTTHAARNGLGPALQVAFSGGSVMGMGVVGLGLLGLGLLVLLFGRPLIAGSSADVAGVLGTLTGFSFGASSIALFARVGGGIYTKAADVGADLVGKVESGIPEDHPLNPATIADNVGDNVGDVAGMGADLFESYVGSLLSTMVLGAAFVGMAHDGAWNGLGPVLLPLALAGLGILTSMAGSFFVRTGQGQDPQAALNRGTWVASALHMILGAGLVYLLLPGSWGELRPAWIDADGEILRAGIPYTAVGVYVAMLLGLVAGLAIGRITEHYTGLGTPPVLAIARQSVTGAATNVIAGLGVGLRSTAGPILVLAACILGANHFAGLYGIAMAAVGMLANTGMQLAVDAYGPISDNAGGIAEMSGLPKEVRERTDKLDAVGNTTAAVGKGFAIGSAALTALALFAAFKTTYEASSTEGRLLVIEVTDPKVMASLLVGAMLPFLFSSLAMAAVGRAAMSMIEEVRRQYREIPALKSALSLLQQHPGRNESDWSREERAFFEQAQEAVEYGRCVEISTQAALRQMLAPGLLAVLAPVGVGFLGGGQMLGGLLAGVTVSGVLLALFQSNAGGAWDNAKKQFEAGVTLGEVRHGKGSDAHKAAVVGDTVGDPLKDTSGPSLNILLKLISVVALVIAPWIH